MSEYVLLADGASDLPKGMANSRVHRNSRQLIPKPSRSCRLMAQNVMEKPLSSMRTKARWGEIPLPC